MRASLIKGNDGDEWENEADRTRQYLRDAYVIENHAVLFSRTANQKLKLLLSK